MKMETKKLNSGTPVTQMKPSFPVSGVFVPVEISYKSHFLFLFFLSFLKSAQCIACQSVMFRKRAYCWETVNSPHGDPSLVSRTTCAVYVGLWQTGWCVCCVSPQCVWTAYGRGGQQHSALPAAHWEKQGEWAFNVISIPNFLLGWPK